MYRCQNCLQVTPPRTRAFHWPVETRPLHYPIRFKAIWKIERKQKRPPVWIEADEINSPGIAIVREITVCPDCHALLTAAAAQEGPSARGFRASRAIPLIADGRTQRAPKRPRKRPKGLRDRSTLLTFELETARSA